MKKSPESFKDLFSAQAAEYAKYRPSYPQKIYEFLSSLTAGHDLAWDCGTGNGQAAVGLARYFKQVVATDPSASQIQHAVPHANVRYAVAPAEKIDLPPQSVDLVTVAQAVHWFHFEAFYSEVRRVLKSDGVIALWGYGHDWTLSPEVDALVRRYNSEIVGEYWAPEIQYVRDHYKTLPFPFKEIPAPEFSMAAELTMKGLIGYLSSWSSTQKYLEIRGENPLLLIEKDLLKGWGDPETARKITWPLYFRVGRR